MDTIDIKNVTGRSIKLKTFEGQSNENISAKKIKDTPSLWPSKRLLVSLVLFLNFMNFQIIRNNINIAVVEMTAKKIQVEGNVTIHRADFDWDSTTVGFVLSIFAYGGTLSFVGGYIANCFGGAVTCTTCALISGIMTLAHPASLYFNYYSFLALRFLTGLSEEIFYLSTVEIHSLWYPKKERSLLISISFNGLNAGIAVVYPFCGYLAHKWGWEMVFYVTGSVSILVAILLWIFVKNTPSEDKKISKKELEYILADTDQTDNQEVSYPLKSILGSGPVWSLFCILFTNMWVSTVIGACLPLYVEDYTRSGTGEVGLISSIPNLVYFFMFPFTGIALDYWKNHSKRTFTHIHKTVMGTAFLSAGVYFLIAALVSNFTLSLVIFVLVQILTCPTLIVTEFITINLAPDHCNTIAAFSSVFLSVSTLLTQTTTGVFLTGNNVHGWRNCFFLASGVSLVGSMWFTIFGSSETQSWSAIVQS